MWLTLLGKPMFDAHFHIIDSRFPLVSNQGFLPEPFDVGAYRQVVAGLKVTGGAVVSGSFQAFDQSYLETALSELGPGFVGVTQLPGDTTDEEIARLDRVGVRGMRFNLRRGGSAGLEVLARLGRRAYEVAGWHSELYVDARHLPDIEDQLSHLPLVGIDHLGLSKAGLPHLLRFVDRGGFVKATGFGRVDFDVGDALSEIANVNPEAIVFGTDLPSTRAPRPFHPADIDRLRDALGDKRAELALQRNGERIYLRGGG